MQANSENGRDDKGAAEIAAYKKSYAGFFKAKPVNMWQGAASSATPDTLQVGIADMEIHHEIGAFLWARNGNTKSSSAI